ncbi:MAG: hypothetical protein OER96_05870 [Gammaproteobacteria bacterium]|nr:hypothetical protein [Gammaproteobacteria bacterium]
MESHKPVHTDCEITGMETRRMIKQYAIWKPLRFGWIAEGPGWRMLFELYIRHRFGYRINMLTIRYEKQWRQFRTFVSRIANRFR